MDKDIESVEVTFRPTKNDIDVFIKYKGIYYSGYLRRNEYDDEEINKEEN